MFKDKALASLSAGDLLLAQGLPDDAMSRFYYAMYRAAVHVLTARGHQPSELRSGAVQWDHSMIENNAGLLRGNRDDRRLYREMRALRVMADYGSVSVGAERVAVRRAAVGSLVRDLTW